jgi:gluconolactonase
MQGTTTAPAGFVRHDPAFVSVIGDRPELTRVLGTAAHEGPTVLGNALYYTTAREAGRETRIMRVALDETGRPTGTSAVVDAAATMPNGMTAHPDGRRLLVCEQGDHREPACLSAIDPTTGARQVLVAEVGGAPLNSPNDVAVGPDGVIWFTDPSYGHLQGFRPAPRRRDAVYRLDPFSGTVTAVADAFDKPNGIVVAPDGRELYVTDSGADRGDGVLVPGRPHHVMAYAIDGDGGLRRPRVVAATGPGTPDGLKVDAAGNLYVSSNDGVVVVRPDGRSLGVIAVPGVVNFTFGGPASSHLLYMTADTAIWVACLAVTGPPPPTITPSQGVRP